MGLWIVFLSPGFPSFRFSGSPVFCMEDGRCTARDGLRRVGAGAAAGEEGRRRGRPSLFSPSSPHCPRSLPSTPRPLLVLLLLVLLAP